MKIHNSIGSKERLFEMFQGVNKIQINEVYNPNSVLDFAFEELIKGTLNIQHTNTQTKGEESYVELVCTDKQNNSITFSFRVDTMQGDQDGVFELNNAGLINFTFDSATGEEVIEMEEDALKEFNTQHASEFAGILGDYIDVEVGATAGMDEIYEEAIKKIDSYPYGGTPERMQTSKAYGDEKPTNPKVRVKSPELDKFEFVDEGRGQAMPDTMNMAQHAYDTLDPMGKEKAIQSAKQYVDNHLAQQGLQSFDVPQDEYREHIKKIAVLYLEGRLSQGNYGRSMNEEDGEKKEKNDYPDQMGKKFKPKNQMPKKKRKPQTVVKLGEQYEEDDDEYGIPDLEIPMDKNAEKAARGDIHREIQGSNKGVDQPEWKHSLDKDTKFTDMSEEEESEEETGDVLAGGKADDSAPQDFDPEQLAMGLKIEMEHTDDPKLALEIAMDHLVEIADYYTRLEKMEAEAGVGEEGESEDDELTDRLLGYEPKNVGDDMEDLTEEDDLFGRMGDVFRPQNVGSAGNRTKTFKIGEYAVGGIIKVNVAGQSVNISALDWNTKEPVESEDFTINDMGGMDMFLNDLTSSYYAEKVLDWIKGGV